MAEVFRDFPGRAGEHGAHRRALQRRRSPRARTTCRTSTCRAGFTLDDYFEHVAREGFARAAAAAAAARRGRRAAPHDRRVRAAARVRDRDDQADEVPGYFLIVWDFIRYAREQGIPVGPGPRLGGRQPGRLLPAHHRRRSARLRPDLRALPQPRARLAARYRHRLLRAPPRRGDRLRHAQVRPRERRADHHLRHDEGEGGRARRRPRARHAVRRRRQGRQADSAGARHDARQGARGEPGAQGDGAERPEGQGAARRRAAPRRHDPPRLGPRRRRRHRAEGRSPSTRRSTRARATKSSRSGR